MSILKEDKVLSKNKKIVYEVFNLNPFTTFSVNRLLEIINKNEQIMSRRTVFRAVKKLIEVGKIHCSDINKGTRSFEILKSNYCIMICEMCSERKVARISNYNSIDKALSVSNDFCLKRLLIEIRGVCKKCC